MNCPACGSVLKEHTTGKGTKFLTCSRFPTCKISGTPELLERLEQVSANATAIQGAAIAQKNKHSADMERLWGENERRRKILDELFRCCVCSGWFPVKELQPSSPDPQADPICNRCLNNAALREQIGCLQRPEVPVEDLGPEPVPLGAFITQVAQLKIHQSRLRAAKTAEEREAIRKQALEAIK